VKDVLEAKTMMGQIFDCEDVGIMNEYVGCKITRDLDEPSLRMMQPVLLQSFEDEFDPVYHIIIISVTILLLCESSESVIK
jgi:hypothetical protein